MDENDIKEKVLWLKKNGFPSTAAIFKVLRKMREKSVDN